MPGCSEPPTASSGAGGYLKNSGPSQPCAHSPSSPCCTPRWPSPMLRDLSQGHWGEKENRERLQHHHGRTKSAHLHPWVAR